MRNTVLSNFNNALPSNLNGLANALCRHFQVDISLVIPVILGLASALTQDKYKVLVKDHVTQSTFTESLSLFCLGIADSSERKTPVMKWLKSPIQERLNTNNATLEDAIRKQNLQIELAEAEKKKLKKKLLAVGRNSSEGLFILDRLQAIEAELNAPKLELRRIFLQDSTAIAAAEFLQKQEGNSLVIGDGEGGSFDSILSDHRLMELLLSGFSNEGISYERSTKPSIDIQSPHTGLCVLTQEVKLQNLAQKKSCWDEGFVPRSLCFIVPSMAGFRNTAIGEAIPQEWQHWWQGKCQSLLQQSYKYDENGKREYTLLHLSDDAALVWRNFSAHLESMMQQGTPTYPLRAWLGKMGGVAARVASLYHLLETDDENNVTISTLHMQLACNLIFALIPHMQYVHSLFFPIDDSVNKAIHKIVSWIQYARGTIEFFSLRDMYREINLPKDVANMACDFLMSVGVLYVGTLPPTKIGRKASVVYGVNYQVLYQQYPAVSYVA